MKTLNYCQRFSKFKNRETIAAVRRYKAMKMKISDAKQ